MATILKFIFMLMIIWWKFYDVVYNVSFTLRGVYFFLLPLHWNFFAVGRCLPPKCVSFQSPYIKNNCKRIWTLVFVFFVSSELRNLEFVFFFCFWFDDCFLWLFDFSDNPVNNVKANFNFLVIKCEWHLERTDLKTKLLSGIDFLEKKIR